MFRLFDNLSNEMTLKVTDQLSFQNQDRLAQVNKGFNNITEDKDLALLRCKKLSVSLTNEELRELPIDDLWNLDPLHRNILIKNIHSHRRKEELTIDNVFKPDNYFLSGLGAFLNRGISLSRFAQLDSDMQILLTTHNLAFRLLDKGISFEKIEKLSFTDLNGILSWLADDMDRLLSFSSGETKIMNELNQQIENKIHKVSYSL